MASFVFEWKGNRYPNIHGRIEHYEGGQILQVYDKDNNKFKKIESRYLAMLRQQLAGQQKSDVTRDYVQGRNIAQFRKLEASIEQQMVNNYNNFTGSFGSTFSGIAGDLSSSLQVGDKEGAMRAVDNLISIFKSHDSSVNLINEINSTKLNSPISVELAELLKIGNLINLINNVLSGTKKFSEQSLAAALTAPSRALSALIDAMAEETADEEVINMLKGAMNAGVRNKVTYTFGDKRRHITQNIVSGGQNLFLSGKNIQLSELITTGKKRVDLDYTLNVDSYVKSKTSRSKSSIFKLSSYSGENSLLINELRSIYSRNIGNDEFFEYQAYNTLAFTNSSESNELADSFKIIKSDIICDLAEKFIAGFEAETAQRVLIFNFKAYSILAIVSAIAREGTETIDQGGTYDKNNIFNLTISTGGIRNDWIGGAPNSYLKSVRINMVKRLIDTVRVQGSINLNNLDKYLNITKMNGISLSGIVPQEKS